MESPHHIGCLSVSVISWVCPYYESIMLVPSSWFVEITTSTMGKSLWVIEIA